MGDDGAGDRHALLLTAGQFVRIVIGALRQADLRQRFESEAAPLGGGNRNVGLLGLLMPSRPSRSGQTTTTPPAGDRQLPADKHVLWVLRDGKPARVLVTVGVSDGTHTAVSGGNLTETDQVITAARTAS